MKTLSEIESLAKAFHAKFGLDIANAPQGSEAWLWTKLGVISASNASKVVAKKDSETRATYMAELCAQVATGLVADLDGKALDWGKQNEAAARSCYVFSRDVDIVEVPFAFMDDGFRVGCSADGIILEKGKPVARGVEIKCPYNTANYVKFLVSDKIKPEYEWQYNFCMLVFGAETWDFVQYDPRMHAHPQHIIEVVRDEEKIKKLEDAIPEFIADMDKMLAKIGLEYGSQWKRLANQLKVGA